MSNKTPAVTPAIKWHGGKHYLARRIIELMPPHIHYVEPYAGGLAVLLAKDPEGVSEVVNDLDGALTNFWRVLADEATFERFLRRAQATPFSEGLWRECSERLTNGPGREPVQLAYDFFVTCRQSLAGRMDSFAPISRTRTRRNMNEQASAWLNAVDGLPAVHQRLKRVVVLNRDAIDVIGSQDGPQTLLYLDPPYIPSTRTATDVYAHEMTIQQHKELLDSIRTCKGKPLHLMLVLKDIQQDHQQFVRSHLLLFTDAFDGRGGQFHRPILRRQSPPTLFLQSSNPRF